MEKGPSLPQRGVYRLFWSVDRPGVGSGWALPLTGGEKSLLGRGKLGAKALRQEGAGCVKGPLPSVRSLGPGLGREGLREATAWKDQGTDLQGPLRGHLLGTGPRGAPPLGSDAQTHSSFLFSVVAKTDARELMFLVFFLLSLSRWKDEEHLLSSFHVLFTFPEVPESSFC